MHYFISVISLCSLLCNYLMFAIHYFFLYWSETLEIFNGFLDRFMLSLYIYIWFFLYNFAHFHIILNPLIWFLSFFSFQSVFDDVRYFLLRQLDWFSVVSSDDHVSTHLWLAEGAMWRVTRAGYSRVPFLSFCLLLSTYMDVLFNLYHILSVKPNLYCTNTCVTIYVSGLLWSYTVSLILSKLVALNKLSKFYNRLWA